MVELQTGKRYRINIVDSKVFTVQYSFKPASIDCNRLGSLENVSVDSVLLQLPLISSSQGAPQVLHAEDGINELAKLTGTRVLPGNNERVLLLCEDGSVNLHKISSSYVGLKRKIEEASSNDGKNQTANSLALSKKLNILKSNKPTKPKKTRGKNSKDTSEPLNNQPKSPQETNTNMLEN